MRAVYRNRYGDLIQFERIDEDRIRMTGGKFCRYGFDDDPDILNMVDPSGGPMIVAKNYTGATPTDLGEFSGAWVGLKAEYILKAPGTNEETGAFDLIIHQTDECSNKHKHEDCENLA